MLVRPTRPASRAQLPYQIDRRVAAADDAPVGDVRSAFWRVCDCAGLQYSDSGAAAVFLPAVFDVLGAVFEVWAVSFSGLPIGGFVSCCCLNWWLGGCGEC